MLVTKSMFKNFKKNRTSPTVLENIKKYNKKLVKL